MQEEHRMNSISGSIRPESDARDKRVAALISAIALQNPSRVREEEVIELCLAFDQAVEFAVCEDKLVSTAITEFLQDDWGPAQVALKKLVVPARPFVPSKLPVLPHAAVRLMQTSDETTSAAELARIAGSDPALAAELLRTANSALYGSRWNIYRLHDAVLRVGVPAARKALLSGSLSTLFTPKRLDKLWQHSQRVAGTACQLAELCGADPDTAFVAGLLHDLGRVAFTVFPETMQAAEQKWRAAGFPLIYAETMAYGSDHAAFGSVLLRSWQLPDAIVEAVARHHRPEHSKCLLRAVVHLAEAADEDLWSNMRRKVALDQSGISPDQLDLVQAGRSGAPEPLSVQACG
jgi:putative nucleotidyltransferase with HDIG domain